MKEELLWGLLSFQCFLAAPISLATSWIIPEILAALVSRILWTTGSQLQNKILFSFQMSFRLLLAKEGLLFPLCLYTFLYIHIRLSPLHLWSRHSTSSSAQAASPPRHKLLACCTKEPTPSASWDVTATYTTQTHMDAEMQPVSFRGELLKSTENMVAFQLLGSQHIFSLI